MHSVLRTFLAVCVASLVVAPVALADTATETLLLARDGCGGNDDAGNAVPDDNTHLGWAASGATNCGSIAAGADPVLTALDLGGTFGADKADDYPTENVGTVTLDGTRPIVIDVGVSSYTGGPVGGIGDETVDLTLSGVPLVGKRVTLGSATATTAAQDEARKGGNLYEFTLAPTPAQANTFKSLSLSLYVGGAELGGYVLTDGSSFVELPIPGDVDAQPPA